jgi:hypothetical protein
VTAGACQDGTSFDPGSSSCRAPRSYGTLVHSSPFILRWGSFYFSDPSVPDGGFPLRGLGIDGALGAGAPDSAQMYLSSGRLVAYLPSIPVLWGTGVAASSRSYVDHPLTVGEFKTCSGSWAIYRDPPSGRKTYNLVLDLAGCPPGTLYSIWLVYATGDQLATRLLGAPAGGLPSVIGVDGDGTGHFSRELDPALWLAPGVTVNGINVSGAGGSGVVPDPQATPGASLWIDLDLQNEGQSNGNAGFCVLDVNSLCATPPSPDVYLPGQRDVTVVSALTSWNNGVSSPVSLALVQPY